MGMPLSINDYFFTREFGWDQVDGITVSNGITGEFLEVIDANLLASKIVSIHIKSASSGEWIPGAWLLCVQYVEPDDVSKEEMEKFL